MAVGAFRYASVCDGISAASVAWHTLGWQCAWVSEIDPFASAVIAHRWPSHHNVGDMLKIDEGIRDRGSIDLLAGGTPCQSFSVAGLRGGLDDPRGNLAIRFCQLAGLLRPKWIVWENVPGALSSRRGRDFGSILGALVEFGYGVAYRVLDAQFFGVPQRRRRVFVVGYLGDWRRAAAVLFDSKSLCGNPATRLATRKDVAGTLAARTRGGGGLGTDLERDGGLIANAVTCHHAKGGGPSTDNYVVHTLRGEGFDASEDGTGRGIPLVPVAYRTAGDGAAYEMGDCTAALTTNTDQAANIVAYRRSQIAVRRLTPRECERLQGFPDDYTLVEYKRKPAKDSPRYRAIGNSMAVPVMRWIGERIQAVEEITHHQRELVGV